MIGVQADTRHSTHAIRTLRERAPFALSRAINKSGQSGKSHLVRAVAGDLGIKQAAVRDEIKETLSTSTRLVFRLFVTGKRIPLAEFKAKGPLSIQGGTATRRRGGVTAKLPGGAGTYPHAFLVRLASGHLGVFQRAGSSRLPMYELFGPSLPKVVGKFSGVFFARSREVLNKNVQHEINFETRQIAQAARAA